MRGYEHQDSRVNWSVVARAGYSRPPFDIRNGKEIRLYLERVCQKYLRLEETRKLRVAIDYLVSAETLNLPLELRLATMFILLENLKSTFAKEQGYLFKRGHYRQKSGEAWTFTNLLDDMFNKGRMRSADLSPIKDLRNEIIHSGTSQMSFDYQDEIYERCQDLIREYLLRLLNYSGDFRLYSGRGMTLKEI